MARIASCLPIEWTASILRKSDLAFSTALIQNFWGSLRSKARGDQLMFAGSGDGFVRFALVENEHRIGQAVRGIKRVLDLG